jgi:hypothetical protein
MAAGIGAGVGALGGLLGRDNQETVETLEGGSERSQKSFTPAGVAKPLYGYMGGIGQQMGATPTPYFPGMGYVPPSALTREAVAGMVGIGRQAYGNYGLLSNAASVGQNPYVQAMLDVNRRQVNEALNEDMLPSIRGRASQMGMLGSGNRDLMEGEAAGRAATGLADANAKLLLGAYGQGLGAQQQALGMTGGLMGAFSQPGQMVEGYQQQGLKEAMARFGYQHQEPWQRMGRINTAAQALSPLGQQNMSGATTGATSGLNPNYQTPFQGMMGGAAWGAGQGLGVQQQGVFGGGPASPYLSAMQQTPQNFGAFNAYMPWYGG